ncbi:RCC1 domain-containing protein [Adhaeribacter rhizoryzae]|uniref:T9SS type A sorting domain-containing protein n=1 Tax=Adhaeribacter rhizoryzae TaxID=2607907 RepID=A0A5M6D2Q7_9BACT|nr:T9SS type A sorting domain-containing protein [Adhaeribacter rhizoryzae]KAA5539959.1 T9SS type A sorting domain-containing protein [Adhaeribacter rhizoryzae]
MKTATLSQVNLFLKEISNSFKFHLLIWGIGYLSLCLTSISPLLAQSLGVGGGSDSFHSLAVTANGKVYAWGGNWTGQLGNGMDINRAIPLDISGYGALPGKTIVQVANSFAHSLALASDGTVYAWGGGWLGQLGDGIIYTDDNRGSFVPKQVPNLTNIREIVTGRNFSLAIKADSTVWAWGEGYGPLPLKVNGLSGIIGIAGGAGHSLALKANGKVYAWGNNNFGQLGNGTKNASSVPVEVLNLFGVAAIAAGATHSAALKSDGTVYAWGSGEYFGPPASFGSTIPVKIPNLSNIKAVATGAIFSLALKNDGTVYAWGGGGQGQLGTGIIYNEYVTVPVQVTGLTGITAIVGGSEHALALKKDGSIYAWGSGFFGQLGNGDFNSSYMPVKVKGLNLIQPPLPPNTSIIKWDKTLGGDFNEQLNTLLQTTDGGYILGGWSDSNSSGDKSENNKGSEDYWVIKVNAYGNKEWDKTIGGSYGDVLNAIQQTADGGYILGGTSSSNADEDKSENNRGITDYWVVKLNAAGSKEWDRTFGGSKEDNLFSIQQTTDGGYILGGSSNSNAGGDKSENSKGVTDYWVVKVNASGNKEWDKSIGGELEDYFRSIQQINDGGYILGGTSNSSTSGDKSGNSKGFQDYWVVRLDASGNKLWDKTIGGIGDDYLSSLQQTSDGGYILAGNSNYDAGGDKSENSKGGPDYWVVKLNPAGNKEWDKTLGGDSYDYAPSIQQTNDGGYILGGYSFSGRSGDKTEPNIGDIDYWIIKLDGNGNKEGDKTIGGNKNDVLTSVLQTTDGGYILGGASGSNASGNKSENNKGYTDFWIVKLVGNIQSPIICDLGLTTKVTQAEPWYGLWDYNFGAGSIDLKVTGGTAPYTYQWNAGVSSQDITVAMPGHYSVTVTDANGCKATTHVFVGKKDDFLRVLSSHQNVTAPGRSDGSIDLTVVGGVVPATYRWSNGAWVNFSEDLTNLSVGTYTVVVTDAFGRQATTTVIISEPGSPLSLAISHQNVSTTGKQDGAVDLTIIGGTGPYTYRWNTGAVTEDLHYATPGLYTVIVTDATGATATASIQIMVGRSPALLALRNEAAVWLKPANNLIVYPNPANNSATVNFSLATPGNYTLNMFDLKGSKMKTLATGKIEAHKVIAVEVDVTAFSKGIYLLQLQTEQGIRFQRLLIQR